MLYSESDAIFVLGTLFNKPSLLDDDNYCLDKDDFSPKPFHRIMFVVINELAKRGVKEITYIEVNEFLQHYEEQYEIAKDHGLEDFVVTMKEYAHVDNFEYYYSNIRKFSLLRTLKKEGFDITQFYDESKPENTERTKLNSFTLEDIINNVEVRLANVRQAYDRNITLKERKAGVDSELILERFKEQPVFGLNFVCPYLTTIWHGIQKKQFYMRSGATSSGKTRSAIADLTNLCVDELYNLETKGWEHNPNGGHSVLYIGTEMELEEEVEPLIWAYISGVDSSKITLYNLTKEEEERVEYAIKVLKRSKFYIVDMPEFNIKRIENIIKKYKSLSNIDYVVFDYMVLNSELVREFVSNRGGSGAGVREDMVLLAFSTFFKECAKKYDVGIISSSQVNADIIDYMKRDYQVLRGGKAMADKVTGGSISMPITKKELDLVEPIVNELNNKNFGKFGVNKIGSDQLPITHVETVYKSRFGEFPKEVKIFSNYNLGNMRKIPLFTTTKNFEPINIPETYVQVVEGER